MMVYISSFTTIILFAVIMFYVNPSIDSKNGLEVLYLQLSFEKEIGTQIVKSWTQTGINRFLELIWLDYIYALSYSIFFSSLLFKLQTINYKKSMIIYIPFIAGILDAIENTFEILFLNNMEKFSNTLFFIHSLVASLKWLVLPIVLVLLVYYFKKNLLLRSKK